MVELVHIISQRIARYLEKVGLVERDMESSYLNLPLDDEVNPDGQFTATTRGFRQLSHCNGSSARTEGVYPTNGTTHAFFEPIDFIGKLAALIPPPRLNLTRQITC
jgi:hypothetical protein